MKPYFLLCTVCYVLLLVLPLPLLPPTATEPNTTPTATTTTTAPTTPQTEEETITVFHASAGVLYTFAQRDFLIYTVAAEMPALYHKEALKAQAVATYTYYMYEKQNNQGNPALQGADSAQVPPSFPATYSPEGLKKIWGDNYETHLATVAQAVDEVYGRQILYDGKPISANYHRSNWGKTETAAVVWGADLPYLQSVSSTGDDADAENHTTVTVSMDKLKAAFPQSTFSEDAAAIGEEISRSPAGSVTAITIGDRTYTGQEVRTALGLRSACFTVTCQDGTFTFDVRGYGHGVGLSQYGANALAKQGYTYDKILKHYYTGVTIE